MIRIIDLIVSFTAILVLSPILLIVISILSITGEKEIFYKQIRVGQHRKSIQILKFATMYKNSPNIGSGTITLKNDPRILPFGRLLRKSKVNELPQLWNVLVGDLSLIGPRPLTSENFDLYTENGRRIISAVRPGLSGLGSVVFRNKENLLSDMSSVHQVYKTEIAPVKEKLEVWFSQNNNLHIYFKLIILTICSVIGMPVKSIIEKTLLSIFDTEPDLLKQTMKLYDKMHP